MDSLNYQGGFGNHFATEAVPGALPLGRNSPQRVAARPVRRTAVGQRLHRAARREPPHLAVPAPPRWWPAPTRRCAQPCWKTGADRRRGRAARTRCAGTRWPCPTQPLDFVDGLRTMVVNGDADAQTGMAAHLVLMNRSMERRAFVNADGEMLIVPQQGALRVTTELGRARQRGPGEIALLPRGLAFKVAMSTAPSRGYVCENYGAPFRLPELGPIGSNGLANARDFQAPVAAFEADDGPVPRWSSKLRRRAVARRRSRTRPSTWWPGTATWRRCKYDTRALHDHRLDQLRPPRPVHLHRADLPERHAGHGQLRLRDLPAALAGGRGHLPPALVPPQPDERVHGPGARPVRRQARGLQARRRAACTTAWCRTAPMPRPSSKRVATPRWRRTSWTTRWPSCSRAAGASASPPSRMRRAARCDARYADCWAGTAGPLHDA